MYMYILTVYIHVHNTREMLGPIEGAMTTGGAV